MFVAILFLFSYSHNRPKILPNILEAIGHTPIVRLNKIPRAEGIKCEVCKFIK